MLEEKEANPESVSLKTLESRLALPPPQPRFRFFLGGPQEMGRLGDQHRKGNRVRFQVRGFC